jgi:hypothetical protein
MMTFGDRLRATLSDRGLSKSDFAKLLWPGSIGVDARGGIFPKGKDLVSDWCDGLALPCEMNRDRIGEVLGVDMALFARELFWRGEADAAPELFWRGEADAEPEIQLTIAPGARNEAQLSRHALIRLAQRCGVSSKDDLRAAVRAMWPVISSAEIATRQRRWVQKRGEDWLIPFRLTADGEVFVAVMAGAAKTDFCDRFAMKTVLTLDMLWPDQREAVLRLADGAHKDEAELAAAYDAVRAARFKNS